MKTKDRLDLLYGAAEDHEAAVIEAVMLRAGLLWLCDGCGYLNPAESGGKNERCENCSRAQGYSEGIFRVTEGDDPAIDEWEGSFEELVKAFRNNVNLTDKAQDLCVGENYSSSGWKIIRLPDGTTPNSAPKVPYNDTLEPDDQVSAEEEIAATILDFVQNREEPQRGDGGIDEETSAQLGRDILYKVLLRFRPDVFATKKKRKK